MLTNGLTPVRQIEYCLSVVHPFFASMVGGVQQIKRLLTSCTTDKLNETSDVVYTVQPPPLA